MSNRSTLINMKLLIIQSILGSLLTFLHLASSQPRRLTKKQRIHRSLASTKKPITAPTPYPTYIHLEKDDITTQPDPLPSSELFVSPSVSSSRLPSEVPSVSPTSTPSPTIHSIYIDDDYYENHYDLTQYSSPLTSSLITGITRSTNGPTGRLERRKHVNDAKRKQKNQKGRVNKSEIRSGKSSKRG